MIGASGFPGAFVGFAAVGGGGDELIDEDSRFPATVGAACDGLSALSVISEGADTELRDEAWRAFVEFEEVDIDEKAWRAPAGLEEVDTDTSCSSILEERAFLLPLLGGDKWVSHCLGERDIRRNAALFCLGA